MATFCKTIRKHIFLHPADKDRRGAAVKAALLEDKKKYSYKLDGCLLDVKNIKVFGTQHLLVNGYLSMEVMADFEVFSPKPGQKLDGVINKRSKSHVGSLVMEGFNASLSIPPSCNLDPQVGDLCQFTVNEVVVDGEILFMRGTLTSVSPNPNPPEFVLTQSKVKKSEITSLEDETLPPNGPLDAQQDGGEHDQLSQKSGKAENVTPSESSKQKKNRNSEMDGLNIFVQGIKFEHATPTKSSSKQTKEPRAGSAKRELITPPSSSASSGIATETDSGNLKTENVTPPKSRSKKKKEKEQQIESIENVTIKTEPVTPPKSSGSKKRTRKKEAREEEEEGNGFLNTSTSLKHEHSNTASSDEKTSEKKKKKKTKI